MAPSKINKEKQDFNMVNNKFMIDKKLHEKILKKLREIEILKELKKCTHRVKINKNYTMYTIRLSIAFENDRNDPIYERLYNMRKSINGNKPRNFKFGSLDSKPGLLSNNKRLKKIK